MERLEVLLHYIGQVMKCNGEPYILSEELELSQVYSHVKVKI